MTDGTSFFETIPPSHNPNAMRIPAYMALETRARYVRFCIGVDHADDEDRLVVGHLPDGMSWAPIHLPVRIDGVSP